MRTSFLTRKRGFFTFRYVSIGDIARVGSHPPNVAAVYHNVDRLFALPVGYDLVRKISSLGETRSPESYYIWLLP